MTHIVQHQICKWPKQLLGERQVGCCLGQNDRYVTAGTICKAEQVLPAHFKICAAAVLSKVADVFCLRVLFVGCVLVRTIVSACCVFANADIIVQRCADLCPERCLRVFPTEERPFPMFRAHPSADAIGIAVVRVIKVNDIFRVSLFNQTPAEE